MNPSESNHRMVETFRFQAERLTGLKDKLVKPLNICKKEVKKNISSNFFGIKPEIEVSEVLWELTRKKLKSVTGGKLNQKFEYIKR